MGSDEFTQTTDAIPRRTVTITFVVPDNPRCPICGEPLQGAATIFRGMLAFCSDHKYDGDREVARIQRIFVYLENQSHWRVVRGINFWCPDTKVWNRYEDWAKHSDKELVIESRKQIQTGPKRNLVES